ncbi:MAG: winged helix-turn-helix domain-containing protein [Acidobacteriia bacterium]|nr:winged helix-turn-helix domain-containing protein [Terriglobia bacterium]
MDIRGQIVDTARRIAIILNNQGAQTLPQLQKQLSESNEIVHLALGWLARDDRIEIRRDLKGCQVRWKSLEYGRGLPLPRRHHMVKDPTKVTGQEA